MNYIIGCGGVGSAIIPSFCLLKTPEEITLIDGDIIEQFECWIKSDQVALIE